MTPVWWYRDIWPDDEGDDVLIVQRKLGGRMTGVMDDYTAALVRGFQRRHNIQEDGIVGRKTAKKLGEKESKGQVPEWYDGPMDIGYHGPAVVRVRKFLGSANKPVWYDPETAGLVKRFQASAGLEATGVVDEETAIALGDRMA